MKRVLFGLIVFLLAFTGCVEHTPLPPYIGVENELDQDVSKWQEYGAVYLYDEVRITADFGRSDRRFATRYDVNQAIRILDRSGVKYGTVEVERYQGELKEFEVTLADKNGKPRPLDLEALKEQYLDTGKVVVPRVEPGSVISLRLSFQDNEPLDGHDHVIVKNIPVLQSRFFFLSSHDLKYKAKSYGLQERMEELSTGAMKGFAIESRNIRPLADEADKQYEFLADWLDFSELARATVQLESFWVPNYHYKAPDWRKISENFTRYYHSPSIFSAMGKLESLTEKQIKGKASDRKKADAILRYVQENITLQRHSEQNASRVNINEVLERKTATGLEMSVLLSEMFKIAGLEIRQYVTRAPSAGGFDQSMPSWYQLQLPLISVAVEGLELIAFPYQRMYSLGEYPPQLEGQFALELGEGKTVPLPPSIHDDGLLRSSVEISLSSLDEEHRWQYTLGNHFAAIYRGYFEAINDYSLERFGKVILADYGDNNELNDVSTERVGRLSNLTMTMDFENENLMVSHNSGRAVSLKPFFRKYFNSFSDFDDIRVKNDLKIVVEEEIRVNDFQENNATLFFTCENQDNMLFRVECLTEKYADSVVASRKLTIKKAKLGNGDLLQLLPEIKQLNRIGESHVIYTD